MDGLSTILYIILVTLSLVATFFCGKVKKHTQREERMPRSTRALPQSHTATESPAMSCKKEEESKQMSDGGTAMNWSTVKAPSKEEEQKTDLDQIEDENVFANKIGKLKTGEAKSEKKKNVKEGEKKKSHKNNNKKENKNTQKYKYANTKKVATKAPLFPPAKPIAPPTAPKEVKRTKEKVVAHNTVLKTVDTAMKTVDTNGQTEGTIAQTVIVVVPDRTEATVMKDATVMREPTVMRNVDQTLDCGPSVFKEAPKDPTAGPAEARNMEPSPSNNDNENVTQYEKLMVSCVQPTQFHPPTNGSARKNIGEIREVENGGEQVEKQIGNSKKSGKKSSRRKTRLTEKNGEKKEESEGSSEEKSIETPTQCDSKLVQMARQ